MTINIPQKEMPTGDGNPTAGSAINDSDSPIRARLGKDLETLRASFALHVHILHYVALFLAKIRGQI
jgi:hypothetical protein